MNLVTEQQQHPSERQKRTSEVCWEADITCEVRATSYPEAILYILGSQFQEYSNC